MEVQLKSLLSEIYLLLKSDRIPNSFKKNVQLLYSIPGIGDLTAVTLMSEIGDIKSFLKAKHLVAYFGIDPSVN